MRKHKGEHPHNPEHLADDARLASKLNIFSGIAKTVLGVIASSPVLITDGVHDFGDADTYRSDAYAIAETEPTEKASRKVRAATKLGAYAIGGTLAETVIEQFVHTSPLPIISLVGGVGSFVFNWVVHRRFAHHEHEDAEEVQGHARTDLKTSAVTVGASALAFAWTPALLIGSVVHIGMYSKQAYKSYRKFKTVSSGTVSAPNPEM